MSPLTLDFTGRRILVTGGTRGIGAAIADAFESAGGSVLITGTSAASLDSAVQHGSPNSASRTRRAVDFADAAALDAFTDELATLGPFDVCVNNAGVNRIKPVSDVSAQDLDWLFAVNLRAPLLISRAVAPGMRAAGGGRIVNIASIWSVVTRPGRSLYTAAKTGLVGLTRTLSAEFAKDGVLVNAVSPGFTATDLTRRSLSPDEVRELEAQIPAGRLATPSEIANVVLFLASDLNTYITGQNIVADGGFVTV